MMKKVLKTLVGLVVTFLFLFIVFIISPQTTIYPWYKPPVAERLGPAVGDALSFLFFSIVCTLGLSLFIWIPLWYGIGWVVFELGGWLSKKLTTKPAGETQPSESQAHPSPTWQQKIMLNYIKKARARGLNDEQISQNLAYNGWTSGEVNWAFDALK